MYAPHTNDLVRHQANLGLIPTPAPKIFGCFDEADGGAHFEYAERRWHCDEFAPEFPAHRLRRPPRRDPPREGSQDRRSRVGVRAALREGAAIQPILNLNRAA